MAIDIYSTYRLQMAIQAIDPADAFLRDRYCPTGEDSIFATNSVLVEYRDGDRRLAPFVAEHKGGVVMERPASEMNAYEPPKVAPSRVITADILKKRDFGEALYTQMTPAQREQVIAMRDLSELDLMITRREEKMVAELMLTNAVTAETVGDDVDATRKDTVRYYDGEANESVVSVTTKWDATGANILDDLAQMVDMLTSENLPAEDFVCSPDVAQAIVKDAEIQKLLDIRHYQMGNVAPGSLGPSAALVAVLNVYGTDINIISYNASYKGDDGTMQKYIPSGSGIMTAPGAGRMLYGAVTQVEQVDGKFYTYPGSRVPKYVSDATNNVRTLTVTACPLPCPNAKNPWVSATGLLTA